MKRKLLKKGEQGGRDSLSFSYLEGVEKILSGKLVYEREEKWWSDGE